MSTRPVTVRLDSKSKKPRSSRNSSAIHDAPAIAMQARGRRDSTNRLAEPWDPWEERFARQRPTARPPPPRRITYSPSPSEMNARCPSPPTTKPNVNEVYTSDNSSLETLNGSAMESSSLRRNGIYMGDMAPAQTNIASTLDYDRASDDTLAQQPSSSRPVHTRHDSLYRKKDSSLELGVSRPASLSPSVPIFASSAPRSYPIFVGQSSQDLQSARQRRERLVLENTEWEEVAQRVGERKAQEEKAKDMQKEREKKGETLAIQIFEEESATKTRELGGREQIRLRLVEEMKRADSTLIKEMPPLPGRSKPGEEIWQLQPRLLLSDATYWKFKPAHKRSSSAAQCQSKSESDRLKKLETESAENAEQERSKTLAAEMVAEITKEEEQFAKAWYMQEPHAKEDERSEEEADSKKQAEVTPTTLAGAQEKKTTELKDISLEDEDLGRKAHNDQKYGISRDGQKEVLDSSKTSHPWTSLSLPYRDSGFTEASDVSSNGHDPKGVGMISPARTSFARPKHQASGFEEILEVVNRDSNHKLLVGSASEANLRLRKHPDKNEMTDHDSRENDAPTTNNITNNYGWTHGHQGYTEVKQDLLTVIGLLGNGSLGVVEEVRTSDEHTSFVRKRVQIPYKRRKQYLGIVEQEMKVLQTLSHSHIVQFIGSYHELPKLGRQFYSLLMSPVGDRDLRLFLDMASEKPPEHSPKTITMHQGWLRGWFRCLASALAYMHSNGIRHQDIKPQNIIHRGSQVYFTDFSSASEFQIGFTTSTENPARTSFMYAAPEVVNKGDHVSRHGRGTDVFALGAVFSEMLAVLRGYSLEEFHEYIFSEKKEDGTLGPGALVAGRLLLYGREMNCITKFFDKDDFFEACIRDMLHIHREHRPAAEDVARSIGKFEGWTLLACSCDPTPSITAEKAKANVEEGWQQSPMLVQGAKQAVNRLAPSAEALKAWG